jgi:hypothetical protein
MIEEIVLGGNNDDSYYDCSLEEKTLLTLRYKHVRHNANLAIPDILTQVASLIG